MRIRKLEPRDIEGVLAIQRESPEIAQWTASDYESAARGEMAAWVAEDARGIAGFLVARLLVQETEILNLAVRPDARRRGVGSKLLSEAADWSKIVRAERILLEVRASNLAAQRFYEGHGFGRAGRRLGYYTNPREDAVVLQRLV